MECSAECSSNSESGFCEWELDERRDKKWELDEKRDKKWEGGGRSPDVESKRRLRGVERGEGRRIWRQAASTQDWTL